MFRELARKNNRISTEECVRILKEQTRGVLSVLGDDGYPYGMPMNHWYDDGDGSLYFHCGTGGHRLDALQRCDKASFCVYDGGSREEGQWAWRVKSVILFGTVEIIDDRDRIITVTTALSHKFTQDEDYIRGEIEHHAHRTLLLRLVPQHMRGKLITEA